MAQNIFDVGENENRVLGIVKAKYGLHNKNQALKLVLRTYGEEILEPELRPEFVEKLKKIKKQKGIRFKSIENLRKHIEKGA